MSPVGDVAHLRTLVARERVTVTEQEMEVSMMETEDVDQVLSAAAITAESLAHIITRKMTAARGPVALQVKHQLYSLVGQTGVRGASGPAAPEVESEHASRGAAERPAPWAMEESGLSTPRRDIAILRNNNHCQIYNFLKCFGNINSFKSIKERTF